MRNPTDNPVAPSKEDIRALPAFEGLELEDIRVVASAGEADVAWVELNAVDVCGFDTESKPIFESGQVSDGPHVIQLATSTKAWVIQLRDHACIDVARRLLMLHGIRKVGFGLREDCRRIAIKLNVHGVNTFDLDEEFRQRGYRQTIGARTAVAIALNQQLRKGGVQKSDWSRKHLTDAQIRYAANDAYAAVAVYNALIRGHKRAPAQVSGARRET